MNEMLELVEEVKHIYKKTLPCKKLKCQQWQEAANATHCYLCKEELKDGGRHKDISHITGDFRGVACSYCNMTHLSLTGFELPVFVHNFTGYDSKHVIKSFSRLKVDIIANTSERINHQIENGEKMQTTKIKFLDSLAFLNTRLEKLSVNLEESDKSSLSDY